MDWREAGFKEGRLLGWDWREEERKAGQVSGKRERIVGERECVAKKSFLSLAICGKKIKI